ncbi:MAG: PqqD family protein [Rhodospirillales bacterium]
MQVEDSTVIERTSTPPEVSLSDAQWVLLDIAGAVYYTLEGAVAIRVWQLLATPQSFLTLIEALIDEFDIDRVRCREETAQYLQALLIKGLVRKTASL